MPASATSSRMIRRRDPPMARLMPISRVRSVTLMAIVLMTDRPPTTRLMTATPTMIALKIRVVRPDLLVEVGARHRRELRRQCIDAGDQCLLVRPVGGIDNDLGSELPRVQRRTQGGRQGVKEQLLASGQRHHGRLVRRTQSRLENTDDLECDTAEVQRVSDSRTKLACDVRAQHRDARSFVSCHEEATLGHVDGGCSRARRRRPPRGPVMSLGIPKPENSTSSKGIWTCGIYRCNAGHRPDLVRDSEVDRHDADPDAPARGITDDDLADVVVAAAAHETVDLVGHRTEDDERPDPDGDAEDGERCPQLPPRQLPKKSHDATAIEVAPGREVTSGTVIVVLPRACPSPT